MTPIALSPRRARRWLRDHEVAAKLPRAGRRLLVMTATAATVIERRDDRGYLFLPVPNSSMPEVLR